MESQLLETSPAPSALDLGGAAGAPEHPTMQTLESAPVAPSEAIIEGRVLYRRDLGGIMFVRLEGPWGSVQVVCDRTTLSEGAWAQCPLLVPGSLARFTICSTALSFPWTKDPDVPDASTEALQVKPTVDSLPAPASDLIRETTAERETRSSRIAKADPHRVPEVDPELGHRDCNSNCSRSSDTIPDLSVHSGEHQSAAGASNVRPAAGGPGPQVGGPAADCRRPSTGGATPPEPPPTAATATQSSATAAHPPSLTALTVDLMECHAHPAAVARVLKALEAGTLSPATAVAVLHCSPEELERLRSLSGAPAHDKATAFAYKQLAVTISRRLAGNPKQKRRRPHIRYAYRQLLAKLAAVQAHWALHPLPAPDDCEADAPLDPVHNLVDSSNAARVHYCEARKRPQIAWVLGRVAGMVPPSGRGCTLVDVGCGRGDLAVNAAVRFPEAQVYAIDPNVPSLDAGEAWAAQQRLLNIHFVRGDAQALLAGHLPGRLGASSGPVVLLGLHACGGLTDAIVALALRLRASFLCVTCCFTFHSHLRAETGSTDKWWGLSEDEGLTICRLAEMQGDDAVMQKAMHCINALRLNRVRDQVPGDATEVAWDCRILTFPAEMSPKNQVLWGRCSGDP